MATLVRMLGDIGQAEDALQEAALTALQRWRKSGEPDNPAAWLTTTARNKALDRIRRERARGAKEEAAVRLLSEPPTEEEMGDDVLRLLFTCCHPALAREAQVALALRTISGLTTAEIARAFLVSEPTMGQRISRAKAKIKKSHIPYRVPEEHELPTRLAGVLAVLYLVFTTGHHSPGGEDGARVELAAEAIRLTRLLNALMPDEPEVWGLLALMLATHARRTERFDAVGDLVLLEDQDRSRWDHAMAAEAAEILTRGGPQPGPYRLQAAIACVHSLAPRFELTDWHQIVRLYRSLEQIAPTPVVRVNRAVAEAFAFGPRAGLDLLDGIDGVDEWHFYWSARAELLWRAGDRKGASEHFRRALACPLNGADRRHLQRRLAAVTGSDASN